MITITDDLGKEIEVEVGARRVISLAPSNTEILYALELGDRVVAVDNNTNYPAEAMEKPKVSGYKWLDMETVLGLRPDIIFASSINEDVVPQLEERGLTVVTLAPTDIQGIFDDIRLVGKIMGVEKRGDKLASELEERVKAVTDKTLAPGVPKPRTYLELDSFMGYWTYGKDTFGHELITLSGGENIASKEPTDYPSLTDEFIIASDPEVIIYQTGPWTTTTPEGIKARNGWANITAIRESRLLGVDGDLVSRPGPRIVDGLEAIAKAIHPEVIT
jgi:iron complex transport system substrate-binding protein